MKNFNYLLVLFIVIFGYGNSAQSQDLIPNYDTFNIESELVGETRIINVWTPPTYKNSNDSLPILYMPDGGIKEDFPHIANTIAKLVKEKSIPPILLVGIENTDRRRDLTGFSETEDDAKYCPLTDGAKNFRAFIIDELFDEIAKRYRVNNKKGLLGESLAGLFVMETVMQHPESFDFYIAMDPSLWWNDHFLVRHAEQLFENFQNNNIKLWFAGSDADDISRYTKQLAEILKSSAPTNLTWHYSNEPNEKHHTIFRATKEKAFIWILNN